MKTKSTQIEFCLVGERWTNLNFVHWHRLLPGKQRQKKAGERGVREKKREEEEG